MQFAAAAGLVGTFVVAFAVELAFVVGLIGTLAAAVAVVAVGVEHREAAEVAVGFVAGWEQTFLVVGLVETLVAAAQEEDTLVAVGFAAAGLVGSVVAVVDWGGNVPAVADSAENVVVVAAGLVGTVVVVGETQAVAFVDGEDPSEVAAACASAVEVVDVGEQVEEAMAASAVVAE